MTRAGGEYDADWIVIGSGFGGSVAAMRLAEKGYRVLVLEQGRRFADDDFATTAWNLRKLVWAPRLGLRGILRLTRFKHVTVLSGVGVGGGSLVYANTLYQPHSEAFFEHPQWRELADWRLVLAPHFAEARRMLGVVQYAGDGPSDRLMADVAADLGVADGFRSPPIAVFLGEPGLRVQDPYFDGEGPDRTGCTRCGQCMIGCRVGAKNTLEKNYLWHAERHGAEILAGHRVVRVRPSGAASGSDGYEVTATTARLGRRRFRARGVVLAGGALGTNTLLRRCVDSGDLPDVSARLGTMVRTNSEAITAATSSDIDADFQADIAITASIFVDASTHVTNNTYGRGGDALALTFGPVTAGRSTWKRRLQFAVRLVPYLLRARVRGWSRRSIIFTVMQSTETSLQLRRPRWHRGLQTVQDSTHPVESYLPLANQVAALAATRMQGYPQSAVTESLLGSPISAHFLGGAVIGASAETGVVDQHHRVFGYRNLLICDGSVVPANVGVNPSLTITAMTEAAMAGVPAAESGLSRGPQPAARTVSALPSEETRSAADLP